MLRRGEVVMDKGEVLMDMVFGAKHLGAFVVFEVRDGYI